MEQEREILDRLAHGDREAFDALYLHYAPKVEEMAFWMLKSRTEAEDVMQSIMLKVWERKEEIAQMTRFSNYLFTMTKNAIFDIYNRSLVHEKYESAQLSSVRYFHQSINGLMNRDQNLRENGLSDKAAHVRATIERLYVLRNELILVLNEQKKERTDFV